MIPAPSPCLAGCRDSNPHAYSSPHPPSSANFYFVSVFVCICVAMYSRTKTDEALILFTLSYKRKRKGQLSCEHISKNYHYQDFKKKKANSNTYLCVPNCYSSDQSNEKHLLHCTFCRSLVLRMSHE